VYAAVGGRPNRWIGLNDITELAGDDLDAVARRAEQLGWLVLNSGTILHSAATGSKLWEVLRR
jgi:hypothetical protein